MAAVGRFDPRPRTGGDEPSHTESSNMNCFDPRPRTGGDKRRNQASGVGEVSIRAPARGATWLPERITCQT